MSQERAIFVHVLTIVVNELRQDFHNSQEDINFTCTY